MVRFRWLLYRLRSLIRRQARERELDAELQFHLDAETDDQIETGARASDAARTAKRSLGNVALTKEDTRAVWTWVRLEQWIQDVRYAGRTLRRSPGFSLVAIVTLALGIGANTAIVSLANGLLFRDLGLPAIDRVAALSRTRSLPSIAQFSLTPEEYRAVEDRHLSAIEYLFVTDPLVGALSTDTQAEVVSGELVSGNYFKGLGLRPIAGRLLTPDDDAAAATSGSVVISERLWQRWFNADPSAIGTVARMAGYPLTIVGVVSSEFRGTWLPTMLAVDVWVPMAAADRVRTVQGTTTNAAERPHRTFARLGPGTSVPQLSAALSSVDAPARRDGDKPRLAAFPAVRAINFADFMGPGLLIGSAIVALASLVFLIACANLTNLLLARAAGRAGEVGLRLALGAGRTRVFRLLLVEVGILTGLGAMLGLLLALFITRLMTMLPLPELQGQRVAFNPSPDWRVFGFTLAIAIAAALVVGVVPAWRASRTDPLRAIATGETNSNTTRGRRLRGFLVGAQIAMSIVLVLIAGLYVRSSIEGVNPGYDMSHATMASVDLGMHKFDEERGRRVQRRMVEAARSMPGVQAAALASAIPSLGTVLVQQLASEEQPLAPLKLGPLVPGADGRYSIGASFAPRAFYASVSSGFFQTLGIPLREGREFTDADGAAAPRVAIVSESVARKFWPGQDPLGHRVTMVDGGPLLEVVGVAATVATGLRTRGEDLFVYLPVEQEYSPKMSVIVRTSSSPISEIEPLRQAIRSADSELAVFDARTVADSVGLLLAPIRVTALVLGSLGALGLGIALLGVYGVVAYFVSQRTREFGIRKALGATNAAIYVVVLRSSLRMLIIGAVPGLVMAFVAAGFLEHLLYGIAPHDALTFTVVPLTLVGAGIAASAFAARRAARVEPYVALRTL